MKRNDNKITDYKNKIADFQLAKSNYKKPIKYKTDFGNVKIFFSSPKEAFNRILILWSQILFCLSIIFNGFLTSFIISNLIPNGEDMRIPQITFRLFSIIFSFIPSLIVLFFILPIIICSRIRSVKNWCITFIIYGSFFYALTLLSFALNIFLSKKYNIHIVFSWEIITISLLGSSYLIIIFSSFSMIKYINKKIQNCEKSLMQLNEYNRVKIN